MDSEIIVFPAFFAMVAYIVWISVQARQRRHRLQLITEFNSRLLERLGTVRDFSEFLQTPAGSRFMADLTSERINTTPKDRILRAAQVGVVLFCLGVGLLLLSFFSQIPDAMAGFEVTGAVALSLGIGFVLSAAASYRLAATLGLLSRDVSTSAPLASSER